MTEKRVKGPSIQVIIAAMNEEEGIGATIAELRIFLGGSRILVVDGNSNDKTVQIAKNMGAEVTCQEGSGKGNAIAKAMDYANLDVDYVVFMDADYTYPACYLPNMIEILEENPQVGMVCGNRFNDHLNVRTFRSILYIGNRILALIHNILNRVHMRDPLTGMRVVRAEMLRDWRPKSAGFDVEVELNNKVGRKGFSIAEMPVAYRPRLGRKKLKIRHGVTILKRVLMDTLR